MTTGREGRGARAGMAALIVVAGVAGAAQARAAGPDPAGILRRVDQLNSGYADQEMDVTMTVVDTDGSRKAYEFTIQQKGTRQRLIRFHSGELKGMATLVEDRDRVYVYLPGFKKVRRVAAHSMGQSMAGSDFTNEDMANATWADGYDAVVEREDEGHWVLRCTPKAGAAVPYPEVLLTVEKGTFFQKGVEYRDAAGRPIRRMDSSEPRDFPGGTRRFSQVRLTDLRTGHYTILYIRAFRTDVGLADGVFTQRALEWGR